MSVIDRDLAGRDSRGFPNVVKAGPFLFSRACDGVEGDINEQCARAYGALETILGSAGVGLEQVVRLDHFTESQGWLAERQKVRARFFGRPAMLASTGVAAHLQPPNMLRVAAIALAAGEEKKVLVDGASFGMPAISTAVAGGGYVFLSGVLNDGGYPTAEKAGRPELERQADGCFATIANLLRRIGGDPQNIVRQDVYVSEREAPDLVESTLRGFLPKAPAAVQGVRLPFGGKDLLEVTTVARVELSQPSAALGETPLVFVTAEGGSHEDLMADLLHVLKRASLEPDRLVRVDLCLPDLEQEDAVMDHASRLLGAHCPVMISIVGQPLGMKSYSLSAIAA